MTKTTRVMLAVLAVCGTSAALAQSSVTLYGRVNTSIEHQKLGNASATGLVSNSSFIGFRGTEDLGNGLKAGFILESQFNSDNGTGTADNGGVNFTRQSELNLSGDFGLLRLGTFDPYSYSVTADAISMHNHDTGPSADMLYSGVLWGGNKIAYRTPTFAGFDAEVQYQFGEKATLDDKDPNGNITTPGAWENKGGWDLGVNYANGPLGLGFGYSEYKKNATAAGLAANLSNEKDSQFALRASYELGDLTLGAYYQQQKFKEAGSSEKRNVYRLAAKYVIGASELHANIGRADKWKVNGAKEGKAPTQWTLAYNYNLSKRTKVYALYSSINNAQESEIGSGSFNLSTQEDSYKFRTFGVGIRHFF
ncbi:MAG TPA: porin [Comamonas kerstersii]|nr:porin [Comamonas kerstersii]